MDPDKLEIPAKGNREHPVVAYVFDEDLAKESNKIKPIKSRANMVHALIEAYGLLSHMKCLPSRVATVEELLSFQSSAYLEFLATFDRDIKPKTEDSECSDNSDCDNSENEYGIGYDCPPVNDMTAFVSRIAGGTLTAVEAILNSEADIAINWAGGWHHAQRDEAKGFCYINDIVIGIQKLQSAFKKILYIDFDAHHGDGVENAFSYTKKVFTLSIHGFEPGFFPGTGNSQEIGFGRGKYYAANIPLHSGISDNDFVRLAKESISIVASKFKPDVMVVQCGCDCLGGDPLGNLNLSEIGLGECVRFILEFKLPTIFLGGGGYNIPNAARCWTYLTSIILKQKLSTDIPEHNYFTRFGPDFDLHITPSFRTNLNTPEYISSLLSQLQENVHKIL